MKNAGTIFEDLWIKHNKGIGDPELHLCLSLEEIELVENAMKSYALEAIKTDRENVSKYAKAKNGWSTIDRDSIINAPVIDLL